MIIVWILFFILIIVMLFLTPKKTKQKKQNKLYLKRIVNLKQKPVLLMHTDNNFDEMTENMLQSMENFESLERWLSCFDEESYQKCLKSKREIKCISLVNEPFEPSMSRSARRFVHPNSLLDTLKSGREVLWLDTDVVWFQDPMETVRKYPNIELFYTSDVLQDGNENNAWFLNCGVMYLRPTPWVIDLIEEWTKRIVANPRKWDQALLRETINDVAPKPGQALGLPVTSWSNGHIYFVQNVSKELVMVHNTYQYGGPKGKKWRFMESGLWNLPYPFDKSPENKKYLTYDPIYINMTDPGPIPLESPNATEWVRKTHGVYMETQLRQLEAAWNLAKKEKRVLILPRFKCIYDRVWYPHTGRFSGSYKFKLPFICPTDHTLAIWNLPLEWLRPAGTKVKNTRHASQEELIDKPTNTFRRKWTHEWCCTKEGTYKYDVIEPYRISDYL